MPNLKLKNKTGIELEYPEINRVLIPNINNGVSTFIEQPSVKLKCLCSKNPDYLLPLTDKSTNPSSDNPLWPIALTTVGDDDEDIIIFGYGVKEDANPYTFALIIGESSNFDISDFTGNIVGLVYASGNITANQINQRTGIVFSKNFALEKGWNVLAGSVSENTITVASVHYGKDVDTIYVTYKLPLSLYDTSNFYGKMFVDETVEDVLETTITTNGTYTKWPLTNSQGYSIVKTEVNVSGGSANYEDQQEITNSNGLFSMTPSSGYDALSSASVFIKVTKCYMLADPSGSMPSYDNGGKAYTFHNGIMMGLLNAIPAYGVNNTVLLSMGTTWIWWSDGEQTIPEAVVNQILTTFAGTSWTAGPLPLGDGWNAGQITSSSGTVTAYAGQATTRVNLNLMLSSNGYIPYSYNSMLSTLDDYAKTFFKLVEFKDE